MGNISGYMEDLFNILIITSSTVQNLNEIAGREVQFPNCYDSIKFTELLLRMSISRAGQESEIFIFKFL
jgi:hypothetical protein